MKNPVYFWKVCNKCGEGAEHRGRRSNTRSSPFPESECIKCKTARNSRRYWNNRKFVDRYKRLKGCMSCGFSDPRALDFDHVVTEEKSFNIATRLHNNREVIKDEIRKCNVLCANCHRIKSVENGDRHNWRKS